MTSVKLLSGNFAACFAMFDSVSCIELYALALTNLACVAPSRALISTLALIESPMYSIFGDSVWVGLVTLGGNDVLFGGGAPGTLVGAAGALLALGGGTEGSLGGAVGVIGRPVSTCGLVV